MMMKIKTIMMMNKSLKRMVELIEKEMEKEKIMEEMVELEEIVEFKEKKVK